MRTLPIDVSISLESQLDRLALESNFVNNLVDQFSELMPNLAAKLQDTADSFYKSSLFDKSKVKDLRSSYDKTRKIVEHADFINYSDTLVSIPEGFKGDFMVYLALLTKLSPLVYKEANNLLSEYNFILSDFITNKEAKKSNMGHKNLVNKVQVVRTSHLKEIGHYFGSTVGSKTKLKSVIGRFGDLKDLSNLAIELERTQDVSNLQALSDGVNKTVSLLDIIKKNLESNQITEVSGMTADGISQGAYVIAQLIEFVSIFRFKCDQAVASVENTLDTLQRIIR